MPPTEHPLCFRHWLPLDLTLGYCWRCLSEERDPPDYGYGSWWWRSRGWDMCVCTNPQLFRGLCVQCWQRRVPAIVLDKEQEVGYRREHEATRFP